MDSITSWGGAFYASLTTLFGQFGSFLLALLGAFLLLVIGLIFASAIEKLVVRVVRITKIDDLLEKMGVGELFRKFGLHWTLSTLVGWLAKWFVLIAVLMMIADHLGWTTITDFLRQIAAYIPNVIIAVITLVIGLIAGKFVREVLAKALRAVKLPENSVSFLAGLAKWSVIVFAVMAALAQLGVASDFLKILFTGIVAMVALAGGLAFGIGGRDKARELLNKLSK